MPRDIPVGNGKLLICFDQDYAIRELYFPHVGQENHVGGKYCRMGVWTEGQFAWVGPEWERELGYQPDTLVTEVKLSHQGLGVALECHDAELAQALDLLSWAAAHALPSGVLPEQLNPLTGEPLSVSPLTWSHATYIASAHRVLRRLAGKAAAEGGVTPYRRQDDWIERLYAQACDSIHGICKI